MQKLKIYKQALMARGQAPSYNIVYVQQGVNKPSWPTAGEEERQKRIAYKVEKMRVLFSKAATKVLTLQFQKTGVPFLPHLKHN